MPEEKKARLTKASIRNGVLDSYPADSKEALQNDSFEKEMVLFEKRSSALSNFVKRCDDPHTLFDVKLSAYQTLVKIRISEKLSTNAADSIIKNFLGLFLKHGE